MCFSVRLEREAYILLHSLCFSPSGRFCYSGALTSPTGWNRGTNFSVRISCSLWDTTPVVSSAPWLTAVVCDKPVMFQHQLTQCFYGWSNGVSLASPVWNLTKMNSFFFHQLCNNRLCKDRMFSKGKHKFNSSKLYRGFQMLLYRLWASELHQHFSFINNDSFLMWPFQYFSNDLCCQVSVTPANSGSWKIMLLKITKTKPFLHKETLPCLYPFSQGFCRHMSSRLQIGMWWDTRRCGMKETWQEVGKLLWSLHVFSTDRRTTHQWVTRHITPLLLNCMRVTQYVQALANKILCCHTMVLSFEWLLTSLVWVSCRFWSARWRAILPKISSSSGQKRY